MPARRFGDRASAGRELATRLTAYARRSDVLVLALPRGGVPVAAEVARALDAPLDVFLVRKVGVPAHPELAMGAVAEGGIEVLDRDLIRHWAIPAAAVDQTVARERLELDRRDRQYRAGRRPPHIEGRTLIVVDDGLATGATMQAAVMALRLMKPARIVAAAPVGALETGRRLLGYADEVVCVEMPSDLVAVGLWYDDFTQTSDEDVQRLLHGDADRRPVAATPSRAGPPADLLRLIQERAHRLGGSDDDYDPVLDYLGEAQVVLLGEASHGTHEFYRERARLTRRLIGEKGFSAVAVEADWPDAYRVNRYVRLTGSDADAEGALTDFQRFPGWMWRNADVLDFVGWLRAHNEAQRPEQRVGFYGLDLYSLHSSMRAVVDFLDRVDPDGARRARTRYACFDRFGQEMQSYAYAAGLNLEASCEREVVAQLVELRRRAADYARRDGRLAPDDYFAAEQNARIVREAEAYYRTMLGGRIESWNLRDRHMADTLEELMRFLGHGRTLPRIVVWAHNSHVGDARATEMGERGELNVGQIARERFGGRVVNVGFTTATGTVTAAADWDGLPLRRRVRVPLTASYERVFHDSGVPQFLLSLRRDLDLASALAVPHLERAIGVVYRPESERHSHYFRARLSDQFDYVVHLDETRAVEPLDRVPSWEPVELAETYPSGL
jgi:erythromycin esterase-like protein/predicted phosphoribosyltransferase